MYASDKGHVTVVAELLSHGANVELCTHKVLNLLAIICTYSLHVSLELLHSCLLLTKDILK